MKHTFLALALAGTFGVAAAQSMTTGLPVTKPTVSMGLSAPAAAPAVAPAGATTAAAKADPHVNPFNGKLQSVEQIQRDLEQARIETQMLEERLKQTNLAEELKTVPMRKAVEAAQATTAVKKEEAAQKEIDQNMRAPKVPTGTTGRAGAPAADKPVLVKKKARPVVVKSADKAGASADKTVPGTAATPAPAPLPRPSLVSIVNVGGARSAVLEFAGGTLVVADGDSTPFGVLRIHDQNSADVGGTSLRVHNATMARFVVSDAKAVTTNGAPGQGAGAAAVGTPAAPAPQAPAAPAASPLGLPAQANGPLPALPLPPSTPAAAAPATPNATTPLNAKTQMPALQLPPGVSVLPPPR
jgi:hypothetical protein